MKKIIYSLLIAGTIISCNSVEKDAKTVAEFKCLAYSSHGDKRDEFEKEIDKITSKYSGEDRAKLEKLADEEFNKNCTEKIKDDKEMSDYEKGINNMGGSDTLNIDSDTLNVSNNDKFSNDNSSSKYDQMLNDYESYVDQYLVVYKKAMNGDQSAMVEYPELMDKADKLEKSMKEAEKSGNLTTQQLKRMTNIEYKMLNAMNK